MRGGVERREETGRKEKGEEGSKKMDGWVDGWMGG